MTGFRQRIAALAQRRLVRDGLWVLVGYCVTIVAGLASVRLFTELAEPSVLGGVNLLLSVLTLGMHTTLAPITQMQIRYHSAYRDVGDGDRYTWLIIKWAAVAGVSMIAVMVTLMLAWPAARAGSGVGVIGWLAALVAVSVYRGVLITRLQAERRQISYAAWIGLEAVLLLACTGLILAFSPTIEGYIAGQVAGTTLAGLAFGRLPRRGVASSTDNPATMSAKARRQVIDYGLPFASFALLGWVANLSDRYILAAHLDLAAAGQYVAAFGIASRLPIMVGGLMTDVLRPVLFEAENRNDPGRGKQLFSLWITILAVGVIALVSLLYLLGDDVASLLLAEGYRANASVLMCWIAAGYGCTVVAQVVENRLLSLGSSHTLLWTKSSGAAANVLFAFILIPQLGVLGAAIANAAGQAAMLLVTVSALASRQSGQNDIVAVGQEVI